MPLKGQLSLALALAAAATAEAQAGCDGKAVKRRAVIAWSGLNDSGDYDKAVGAMASSFGRGDTLFVGALGSHADPKSDSKSPGFIKSADPDPKPKNYQRVSATPDGLLQSASLIKEDFAAYKAAGGEASQYEVDVFVSNHGTLYVGAGKGAYGLTGDPAQKNIEGGSAVDSLHLQRLARALPKGARIRLVFGQCYGSDTQKVLLDEIERMQPGACACGAALADFDTTAWSVVGRMPYEGTVAEMAGKEHLSLLEASWRSYAQQASLARRENDDGSENAGMSGSERIMLSWFIKHADEYAEIPSMKKGEAGRAEVENSADAILERAKKKGDLPAGVAALVKEDHEARRRALRGILGLGAADDVALDKTLAEIKDVTPDARVFRDESTHKYEVYSARFKDYDEENKSLNQRIDRRNKVNEQRNALIVARNKKVDDYNSLHLRSIDLTKPENAVKVQELKRMQNEIDDLNGRIIGLDAELGLYRGQVETLYNRQNAALEDWRKSENAKRSVAARLLAREKLEEAFLRSAPEDEIKDFLAYRRCELENFGPGPQAPPGAIKGPGGGAPHQ